MLGRVRSKIVSQRTELINQVRGLASEYGVSFSKRRQELMAGLPLALEDAENGLSQVARFALLNVFEDIRALDSRLEALVCKQKRWPSRSLLTRVCLACLASVQWWRRPSLLRSAMASSSSTDEMFQLGWGWSQNSTALAAKSPSCGFQEWRS